MRRAGSLTHREIARRLGISHGRVQQIEAAALRKLEQGMQTMNNPDEYKTSRNAMYALRKLYHDRRGIDGAASALGITPLELSQIMRTQQVPRDIERLAWAKLGRAA